MSLLGSAPAAAEDAFAIATLVGVPHVSFAGGRPLVSRNVTLRADSETLDLTVRLPGCLSATASAAAPWDGTGPRCLSGIDATANQPGPQYSATLKIPQWTERGPIVDVVVRRWGSQGPQDGSSKRGAGNAVELAVAQPYGAVELLAGVDVPFAVSASSDDGRTVYAGIAWRPLKGTTIEFTAEATDRRDDHIAERGYTIRLTRAEAKSPLRLGLWLARLSGPGSEPWRAGLGLEYRH